MLERVMIAGSGGQGIILIGKLLAAVAVDHVPHVTFFPAYGAEVRGGTSNCQVILSSREIASPVSEEFETMLLMNQASIDRFLPEAREGCLVIVNDSLRDSPPAHHVVTVHATEEAVRLGDTRVANFVMLGAYLQRKPVVPLQHVEEGIRRAFRKKDPKLVALNLSAFHTGLRP